MKGHEREMKRTLLTVAILGLALLTMGSNRTTLGYLHSAQIHADSATKLSEPQAATITEAQGKGDQLTEEFHQIYPLSATGLVSIQNINGDVEIAVWDQNTVKVDAVKRAYQRERLDEAKVVVENTADSIRIKTEYPDRNQTFTDQGPRRYNNPATVDYTLTIPRKARLDSAELVNGSLEIEGAEGDVKAASVNGQLKARGLAGEVKLSTVNGSVEAIMTRLDDSKAVTLNSVNGNIVLIIPANAGAQIKASTVHGGITNDFGLMVNDGQYVGHDLSGQIGSGGPRIRLSNVNGPIAVKRG
jgi:DUF4097 and DUF4098 domain-containing protein YvlB